MDELCIFKLELSNENDIPDSPNNRHNTSYLHSISEFLPIKYQIYQMKKQHEQPLNIITSHSPISNSPLITLLQSYIKNQKINTIRNIVKKMPK